MTVKVIMKVDGLDNVRAWVNGKQKAIPNYVKSYNRQLAQHVRLKARENVAKANFRNPSGTLFNSIQ